MAYTTIDKPDDYFNTILYTGTGATNAITGVGFQPDWVWIKDRGSNSHRLTDSVRGATKILYSDLDFAEVIDADTIQSFDADGFTLEGSVSDFSASGYNYVGWNWLANGAGVSNTAGSITSTVSANTTSGFSIVSYTGTGSAATIGHGLSTSPSMILIKNRTTAYSWIVYHKSLGATKNLYLDLTGASDISSIQFNDTEPTSSVFSVGTSLATNKSSDSIIAYCFAEKKGFSKFGSYIGNGNANGPFVYTGFKPAFVLVDNKNQADDWYMFDNKRSSFNQVQANLKPNANAAEASSTSYAFDFLSNGFKLRSSTGAVNNNTDTLIYMAFAENPFVTSTSVPTTAR